MKDLIKPYLVLTGIITCFAFLAGCASLGLAAPQSPSETIAYSYASVAGIRATAAQDLQAGAITEAQAQTILSDTDQARMALDTAQEVLGGGASAPTVSVAQELAIVSGLLMQAQALLPQPK